MKPNNPERVTRRFQELVLRATARAAREEQAHLATLRPSRAERAEARRRRTAPRLVVVALSQRGAEDEDVP
jgi:hypothetical protein